MRIETLCNGAWIYIVGYNMADICEQYELGQNHN